MSNSQTAIGPESAGELSRRQEPGRRATAPNSAGGVAGEAAARADVTGRHQPRQDSDGVAGAAPRSTSVKYQSFGLPGSTAMAPWSGAIGRPNGLIVLASMRVNFPTDGRSWPTDMGAPCHVADGRMRPSRHSTPRRARRVVRAGVLAANSVLSRRVMSHSPGLGLGVVVPHRKSARPGRSYHD